MQPRHLVRRAGDARHEVPPGYATTSRGFARWSVVEDLPAVHTGFGICRLAPDGHIDTHVHSFEEGVYVLDGEVVCHTDAGALLLVPGDYGIIPVGAPHAWSGSGAGPARWAEMLAPQPRAGPREDTFFVPAPAPAPDSKSVDPRDPRTRSFGHVDPVNMEVDKQTQEHLAQSASMRTALLVYSGITVKMMIDTDLGAQLQTMFMVSYDPDGKAGAHDHPLEETYLILDGEVDATFDGHTYRLTAGDIAFAAVGCVHEFSNAGEGIVRWLETQAPQPPARHSYRFARDWNHLRDVLGAP